MAASDKGREKPREKSYREIYERFGSIDVILCNTGGDGQKDSMETLVSTLTRGMKKAERHPEKKIAFGLLPEKHGKRIMANPKILNDYRLL